MRLKERYRVNKDELCVALEKVLSRRFGRRRQIKYLRRRLSAYASSYTIENLDIELDRGTQLRMIFKNLSPKAQLPTALRVRPQFLYHPLREIETYRRILGGERLGTPICYGAIECPEREGYWMFLERVDGPLLWQLGRLDNWRLAAQWLAKLHSDLGNGSTPKSQALAAHLLRYDREFFNVWLSRAEVFLRRKCNGHSSETRKRFAHLADCYDSVIQRLTQLPYSFIHGEFYPSNVIVRGMNGHRKICAIDWEMAAIAPGLIDLAALTSGNWTAEQKTAMLTAYREALDPSHGNVPSMAELREAVDYCRLHLCVQLLGWASDWSPPEKHAQNWLREALRLAGELGL